MALITITKEAKCVECGKAIPIGEKARYYGKNRIYGIGCHSDSRSKAQKKVDTGNMFLKMEAYKLGITVEELKKKKAETKKNKPAKKEVAVDTSVVEKAIAKKLAKKLGISAEDIQSLF